MECGQHKRNGIIEFVVLGGSGGGRGRGVTVKWYGGGCNAVGQRGKRNGFVGDNELRSIRFGVDLQADGK